MKNKQSSTNAWTAAGKRGDDYWAALHTPCVYHLDSLRGDAKGLHDSNRLRQLVVRFLVATAKADRVELVPDLNKTLKLHTPEVSTVPWPRPGL